MEKQKSFRVVMERQLSLMGSDRKKSKESPGKRGDLPIHLAARSGNLTRVREILQNCDETNDLLAKQNLEGETPLYLASENGHHMVVSEILKYLDLHTASILARNGYDPFHVAAKQGHLGNFLSFFHISLLFHLSLTLACRGAEGASALFSQLGHDYRFGQFNCFTHSCYSRSY